MTPFGFTRRREAAKKKGVIASAAKQSRKDVAGGNGLVSNFVFRAYHIIPKRRDFYASQTKDQAG
jgi:hypothetical protein